MFRDASVFIFQVLNMSVEKDFLDLQTDNRTINQDEAPLRCAGCGNLLLDRVMMKLRDQHWHANCLRCSVCRTLLTDKCYSKDSLNYCKDHFFMKYGTQCNGCGKGIVPLESVRKVRSLVFHLQCFVCSLCMKQLATGDYFFLMDDNKLVCQIDYFTATSVLDNGSSSKRPRTTISAVQLEALKLAYQRSAKPSRHVREQLSCETGLDMRVVQVWFQNRRAKEKRLSKDTNGAHWGKNSYSSKAQQTKTINFQSNQKAFNEISETGLADWLFSTPDFRFTVFQSIMYYTHSKNNV